ncbi:MAG TPA: alpha-hydroxy acid oxidase [Thermoanaerobaculia bacterium]|jgi:4-hydroxymandelate oxidase|nr:alpha-hydroxy acid oxidase [Thermoanaerobaculia bacterium]
MDERINLHDYEEAAREVLPGMVYDYYAGGAGDEISVRENVAAWGRVRLRPRVLVDVSRCDLSNTVLGVRVEMPVLTAPCAMNGLAHPEGELAVARAASGAGVIQVLSTLSTYSLEEVDAAAPGPRWFQLYAYRDWGLTRELVERAAAAGYGALCLTVDGSIPGVRERDVRNQLRVPPDLRVANFAHHMPDAPDGSALLKYVTDQFDPGLTWDSVERLRALSNLPLVLKGVLTAEDARLAVEHGAAGIVVSNHGGRQLDTAIATCDALSEVVDAVAGTAEIFVDGGIRRGTDVLKALAFGARAVLIGRPYLWALAVEGEAGVRRMLDLLREELRLAMALSGCPSVAEIVPERVLR